MAFIILDDKNGGSDRLRSDMRQTMRKINYRHHGDDRNEDEIDSAYRMGYKHGWEDHENEEMPQMRRSRDSKGRFM